MRKYNRITIFIKLLMAVFVSAFLSIYTAKIIEFIVNYLMYNNRNIMLQELIYSLVAIANIKLIVGVVIFTLYFYLFVRKNLISLGYIFDGLEEMRREEKDIKIPIEGSNSFSDLSIYINELVERMDKALEDQIKAENTKSELVTNVSHDLRTPLTSIIGYLDIIDNDKYRDEVELRYYIKIAYEKAKVLEVLINDLFELTKMRNQGIKINRHKINIVELLGQLIESYKIQLDNANMVGRTFFTEDKFVVEGDGSLLVRAFENLISNSIKYGSDGRYIDIFTLVEDNKGKVIIKNYGEPISQLDLPHIFDRFYRSDKSRTSTNGGSGLGLAITKSIIELHNGEISVESSFEGTVFIISLYVD